jgi:8-oxo-dGTP pyrophosphatase MutT (NUDIX family)
MPAVPGASGGLIIDRAGQVLLVKPNHGEHWGVPGGAMKAGETAVREIGEEVGLAVTLGTLPVVEWMPPDRGADAHEPDPLSRGSVHSSGAAQSAVRGRSAARFRCRR